MSHNIRIFIFLASLALLSPSEGLGGSSEIDNLVLESQAEVKSLKSKKPEPVEEPAKEPIRLPFGEDLVSQDGHEESPQKANIEPAQLRRPAQVEDGKIDQLLNEIDTSNNQ